MKRIKGNPKGALASWLRQNEDVPGVPEALAKYKKKLGFSDDEFKYASSLRERAEMEMRSNAGFVKPRPGLYFKESTQIVYRVDKTGNTCSWRPVARDWWSKTGDMVKLTSDYGAGKTVQLTEELASKLGLQAGMCVVCGKALTTNKSKEIGIGPTCLKAIRENKEQVSNG
jgi:hypothetical protein